MRPDELDKQERSAQEIIHAIGRASDDVRVPPHFAAGVMAKAAASTRRGRAHWHFAAGLLPWMPQGRLRVAVAFAFVIAVFGAIPQYGTWFKAFTTGVPSTALHTALEQERLWQKNFACATRLDQNSEDYAAHCRRQGARGGVGLSFGRRAGNHRVAAGGRLAAQPLGSAGATGERGGPLDAAGAGGVCRGPTPA